MANLLARLRGDVARSSTWGPGVSLDQFGTLLDQYVAFAGNSYPLGLNTLYGAVKGEGIGVGLAEYVRAVTASPPAFGAQLVRSLVLSQARFAFRRRAGDRGLFTTDALEVLERPWPKGTTGELLSKIEWHAGLAGNAYVRRDRARGRLRVLRPDWVTIVLGSELDPDDPEAQLDAEVIGYAYTPRGLGQATRIETLLPDDVAHWSPLPDPLATERGMSWLTPVIREIQGDSAATQHKIRFFENSATPNLVIKGIPNTDEGMFEKIVDLLEAQHTGVSNAFKTLYLTQGADATVVGSNLKEIDYRALQGASETRISVASRVPAPVLGISEGLAGSSLNAGNYGQSRRNLADIWMYPTLQSVSAALAQVTDVPADAELWFDTVDMPILREDAKDAAEIEQTKGITIRQLVEAGYEPESVVAAVTGQDMRLLRHTGVFSVQLQPPGTGQPDGQGDEADVEEDTDDDDD